MSTRLFSVDIPFGEWYNLICCAVSSDGDAKEFLRPAKGMVDKLNCIVVGVGHLGKHHARMLASMPGVNLAAVVDTDSERGKQIARQYGTRYAPTVAEVDRSADAAVIAVPTSSHYALASSLLRRGVAVMVEKPMTASIDEADKLVDIARRCKTQLHVGHIERFNPALQAIKKHLTQPRYIECDRIAPFGFRCMDVGVVLDMMIHDLDLILHLTGSEIERIDAIGVPVISQHEDVANARITFANGCVANLTASRVATRRERKIRIFQSDAYFSLDSDAKRAVIYRRPADFPRPEEIDLAAVPDPKTFVFEKMLVAEEVPMDDREPLRSELEVFVECVRTGREPEVGGEDGRNAIAAATEIIRQIRQHAQDAAR